MKHLFHLRILPAVLTTVMLMGPVIAQTGNMLEEIVVTAQKREQSLYDIGITIDAFSGESMRRNGVNSLIDLSQYSPGLNIRGPFGDFGYPIITLRGVNTDGFVETLPQSTGVYTDGVYISQPPMLTVRMFDLERVEVLKGPQGTIYGRNTIAGAVNFIAKRPTFEPEGYIEAGYGRHDRTHVEAAYGGPLSEKVAGRAAIKYLRQFDGPLTNLHPDVGDGGEIDQFSGRVSLLFAPNEDIELLVQGHAGQDQSDVWPFSIIPGGEDTDGNGVPDRLCNDFFVGNVNAAQHNCLARDPFVSGNTFNDTDGDPYTNNLDGIGRHNNRSVGAVAELNWDLGALELTSLTGYDHFKRKDVLDEDAGPTIAINDIRRSEADQFSQEIRLFSENDNGLTWLAGAYFSTDELVGDPSFDSGGRQDYTDLETETYAIFGQAEYPLTGTLKATLGGRYSWIDRQFTYSTNAGFSIYSVTPADVGFKDGDWSGRIALDWQVNEDVLLYAGVSRGFNAGTYNSQFINNAAALEPTTSESLIAYEAGIKARFYGGKLSLTAAGFYYDYEDMQVVAVVPTGTIDSNRLTNAEGATLSGFELQVRVLPIQWLDVNLGVSYVDSEFGVLRSPAPATGTGGPYPYNDALFGSGQTLQLKGEPFPNTPEWSFNSTTRATIPVNPQWNLIAQADISWEDDIPRDLIGTQALFTRSHWNVDGSITLQSADDTWYASLWGRNLANDTWITEAYQVLGFGFYIAGANYNYPRTYGFNVGRKF